VSIEVVESDLGDRLLDLEIRMQLWPAMEVWRVAFALRAVYYLTYVELAKPISRLCSLSPKSQASMDNMAGRQ
jgi:hypothetical protein